jgi:hypothetical protein
MIGIIFSFGSDIVEVRIDNNNVFFRSNKSPQFATIDGLKLDKNGVIKEFPELKDREDWKEEAIKRFKEKIKSMKDEKEQTKYIIDDLEKWGYKANYLQRSGHRPVKL